MKQAGAEQCQAQVKLCQLDGISSLSKTFILGNILCQLTSDPHLQFADIF